MKYSHLISILIELISLLLFFYQISLLEQVNIYILIFGTLSITILSLLGIIFKTFEDRDIKRKQGSQKAVILQNLYDRFKNQYNENIPDEIWYNLKALGNNEIEEILGLKLSNYGENVISLYNNNWKIEILITMIENGITLFDNTKKSNYFYGKQKNDDQVKEKFLEYFINQCKESGFQLKK